jgi:antitoxin HicB
MFLFEYSATLAPDEDGGFVVTFADFPEAFAQGETEQEALEQAADSLEEAVANRIVMSLDLPEPSAASGAYTVAVPASTALKAVLYQTIRGLKMSKVQVAAHLGVDEKEVRNLLDPYHQSKLNRIEELLKRLGRRVVVGLQSLPSEATSVPVQLEGAVVRRRVNPPAQHDIAS